MRQILFFLFVLLDISSCMPDQNEFDYDLINQRLNSRQNQYLQKKLEDCKNRAYEEAVEKVDELLIDELNLSLLDSISFPRKPSIPKHPGDIEIDDSTQVKKILVQ